MELQINQRPGGAVKYWLVSSREKVSRDCGGATLSTFSGETADGVLTLSRPRADSATSYRLILSCHYPILQDGSLRSLNYYTYDNEL